MISYNKKKICVVTGTRAEYGLLCQLMRLIKKDGFIIKTEKVSMAKIMKRLNQYAVCKPPKNLPVRDIEMIEYWISK